MSQPKLYFRLLEGPLPIEAYKKAANGSDLDTLHPLIEKLARLTFTLEQYQYDGLTGLLMRDPFMNKIQARINDLKTGGNDAQQKYPESFLIMLDIKGLHEINEKGHDVGNEKLKMLGRFLDDDIIISNNGMEADAGRLGGDEFAVLISYNPDLYNFESASQSVFARLDTRMCNDPSFPGLNIGKAVEVSCNSEVIELFKGADPKAPQAMTEKMYRKFGRLELLMTGQLRNERRTR